MRSKRIRTVDTDLGGIAILLLFLLFPGCEPLVTEFEDSMEAIHYRAKTITAVPAKDTLTVMTWNIRFGAARLPWFGDSCGDRVVLTDEEVTSRLEALAAKINELDPDILLLQEADVESKRTGYKDQVQWLLDHTALNYGAYASMWQSQFIPSDGLGRVNTGNAVLSKWEISETERIQLPLRGDQDALTKMFYLRRNILKTRIALPGKDNFYAVVVHATAFATDDTKEKHLSRFKTELDDIVADGGIFVAGGDLNEIPPGATKLDYCLEDQCEGESFHADADGGPHKEGSYFQYFPDENTWLEGLYQTYYPAVPLTEYHRNEQPYFTHTPDFDSLSSNAWDRKIDYLWSSHPWVAGSDSTHQEATALSDHCPVTARWVVP
jgi:endonuclease/exonuclease/phosphatase family metal-dependent hydrolase